MTFTEWQDAMSKVLEPGDAIVPKGLVTMVASDDSPRQALSDFVRGNRLFASLHEEFPFFRLRLPNEAPLSEEDRVRGIGVLRWLIAQFQEWSPLADPELERFVALVVVLQSCPWDSVAWFSFDEALLFNAELVERLRQMISSAKVTIQVQDLRGDAKAEDARLTQLIAAGATKDWKTLLFMRRRMRNMVLPNPLIIQAVRYLFRYSPPALVAATSEIQDVSYVQQILGSLTVGQALQFARQNENGLIQLTAIEIALQNNPQHQLLSEDEERSLADLLKCIMPNEQTWIAFLDLFNEHPSAYPSLQVPIGSALVLASDTALAAYVQSLRLSAPCNLQNRETVSVCLATFRNGADETRRRVLWEEAFQRWSSWGFEGAGTELLEATFSELDYAVIGYLKECIDGSEVRAQLSVIESEIDSVGQNWFRSIIELYTSRNRLLSRLQQFAHALSPSSESHWLAERPRYQPTGGESLYAALRFSIRGGV